MTETPSSNPKQLLADLIDAYTAAKMTGNETLVRISLGPLQSFLNEHDIVPVAEATDEPLEE